MNETIHQLNVAAFQVPTDFPESDGTATWDKTTMVVVQLQAGKERGLGYSYAHAGAVRVIRDTLFPIIERRDPAEIPALWEEMNVAVRNLGRPGIAASAIAAVDIALWDLKARLLGQSLVRLLGPVRQAIPVYGSGGFTSYPNRRLQQQFEKWVAEGILMVKMKVGRQPERDADRVKCGERMLLPQVRDMPADTLLIADGFSCGEQVQQLLGKTPLHTAEVVLLALREGRRDNPEGKQTFPPHTVPEMQEQSQLKNRTPIKPMEV